MKDSTHVCRKCGVGLSIPFNWNRTSLNKSDYICRSCATAYKKSLDDENRERVKIAGRERMREWREKNPEKSRAASVSASHKHRDKLREYSRSYSKTNRTIKNAQLSANAALKRGIIKKEPCAVCGCNKVQMHHHDYEKPIDVQWLCPTHHARVHRWKD